MNIDFIKWMCEKAGWKYRDGKDVTGAYWFEVMVPYKDDYLYERKLEGFKEYNPLYPLLLQRAIEGIEEKTGKKSSIYLSKNIVFEGYVWKWDNIGQSRHSSREYAKEAALKYIWEQEKAPLNISTN